MAKRRGKSKKKSQRHARARASARLRSQEPVKVQSTTGELVLSGDPSEVMQDEQARVADARLAARMLSMGVVPDEKAANLLCRAYEFAENAADIKEFRACMEVIFSSVKLRQNELKVRDRPAPLHLHQHLESSPGERTDKSRDIRAKIAAKIGLRGFRQ